MSENVDARAQEQSWLAAQPEDVKEAALAAELEKAKDLLGPEVVKEVGALTDDEADAELAEEIRVMKARDPREWVRLLASFPAADREKLRDVERRFGL